MPLFRAAGAGGGMSALQLLVSGAAVGSRTGLNLIPGSGVSLAGADNPAQSRVDVTIAATGAAGGYSAAVLADAPARYYRLADAAGTTATDSSANAKNATYSTQGGGGAGYTLAQTGATTDANAAVVLNGTTGYVDMGAVNGLLLGQADWTFECFCKPTSVAAQQQLLGGDVAGNKVWGCRILAGGSLGMEVINEAGATGNSTSSLTAGVFSHVAFVFTAANRTITYYINGVASGTGTITATNLSNVSLSALQRVFGCENPTIGSFFGGTLDEVALYTSALSAARISAHYNAR